MKKYSYNDAYNASLEYFNGDELAAKVFVDKYALRDNEDNILEKTPKDLHSRLAKEFARIEKAKFKNPLTEEQIYKLQEGFKYIVFQGSPMYAIGNPYQYVSSGNCFVLPSPYDSYLGINYTDSQIAQISCRRGGVGWDVSNLRPANMAVSNAAKTTSGMIEFVKRYSNTIREVAQFGRRGASLQSLHVAHPQVLDFITVKQDLTQVTGSNISIKFTDQFMEAVLKDSQFQLQWPVDSDQPRLTKLVKAKEIWSQFVHSAWLMAEPGCIFIDTVHRESTGYHYGHIETSSNPCGEQFLPPYASCRLLVLNLLSYVENPYTDKAYFNYKLFREHARIIQRLGDDLVDLEIECVDRIIAKIKSDPEPEYIKKIGLDLWDNIRKTALLDRRTGCGFTALGDALAALNIKYGSQKSIEFCEEMQKQYALSVYRSSVEMAKELGPFPQYDSNIDIKSGFIQRIAQADPELWEDMKKYGRRNMVLLTIAPTGSVSCLTQTTSGLEPVFMLKYMRRKKGNPSDKGFRTDFIDQNGDQWMHFDVYHHGLQRWMKINGTDDIEKSPYYKATANDIDWINRVKMQAALQKWIDNSISSTVNLPNDVTEEVVSDIYLKAWQLGCKGITVYRDGCRTGVLVNTEEKAKEKITKTQAPKRPSELPCDVHHVKVKGVQYFVLVGLFNNDPYEVFAGQNGMIDKTVVNGKIIKKSKGKYEAEFNDGSSLSDITKYINEDEEALTRLTSTALRHGADVSFIVSQLEKTNGHLTSFSKAMARALKKYIKDGIGTGEKCDKCGGKIVRQDGCSSCIECGNSKCN